MGVRSSPVARRPAWSSARIGIRFGLAREGAATGPFFGPPSGRPIELTIIDIARVRDGKVVEHWGCARGVPDRFAVLAQTGVLNRLDPQTP